MYNESIVKTALNLEKLHLKVWNFKCSMAASQRKVIIKFIKLKMLQVSMQK